jgi:acetyltransferase-like isoleucine patch superfamily enzyme
MRLPHDAFVDGDVVVRSFGRLEIGSGLAISGIPVATHVVVGPRGVLRIGRRVRIAHGVSISAYGEVIIGDDVVIGPLAIVMDTDYHDRHQHDVSRTPRPVRIGDGVRLGAGVVVLRGAVIGEGARVAAHSVASRYVPARSLARGVPARPLSGG